jgi:tetratricopeptide (TPR) repeat protein
MRNSAFKAMARAAGPVGLVGAVGGFLSDVFLPLANFAPVVFAFSVIATIFAYVWLFFVFRRHGQAKAFDSWAMGSLVAAFSSAMIFGLWSVFLSLGPERGYLATNVDPIADIQARLLGIEESVEQIEQTTEQTATQVAQSATAQAEGFASLEEALANIQSGQQVIIESPGTPQEWYNNARIYQLRGDTANAITAYEGFIESSPDLEFVDPFEDYVDLLTATQGIARAREIFQDLGNRFPTNRTIQVILASLLDGTDARVTRLTEITSFNPQFGPAFFYLGQELDRKLREELTNDLLQRQQTAYQTLLSLEQSQQFSVFYVDKVRAQEKLDLAQLNYEAYSQTSNAFGNVGVEVTVYSEGALFIVILPEVTGEALYYGIDDPNPSINMGTLDVAGTTYLNTTVGPLQVPVGEHTFYYKYVDKNGVESQVYEEAFTIPEVLVIWTANPPDFSTGIRSGNFLFMMMYEDTAKEYTFNFSLDTPALDQSLSGYAVNTWEVTDIPVGDHILYIQAVGADGTTSAVVEYPFTVE